MADETTKKVTCVFCEKDTDKDKPIIIREIGGNGKGICSGCDNELMQRLLKTRSWENINKVLTKAFKAIGEDMKKHKH